MCGSIQFNTESKIDVGKLTTGFCNGCEQFFIDYQRR